MTKFTEGRHPGEAIFSEGPGAISRDNVTVAESQTILANGLISKVAVADGVTVTTSFAGTGNGAITMADPAVNTKVKDGVYRAVCIEPASNGGTFDVTDPSGKSIGSASVGAAFNKEIKFTIADGATDFVAGDTFEMLVVTNAESFTWVAYDPEGSDGSEIPGGMSIYPVTTGEGETVKASALTRLCELNGHCIAWPEDITDAQKVDAEQALSAASVIVRY